MVGKGHKGGVLYVEPRVVEKPTTSFAATRLELMVSGLGLVWGWTTVQYDRAGIMRAYVAGSAEGVRAIAAYGEGLQRTYLSPDHLVPHFLRLAVEASESIAAHVDTSSDALNTHT